MKKGMIHVYYGDGKGKSSICFGMVVRMLGWGKRVLVIQFLKGQESGEGRYFGDKGVVERFGKEEFLNKKSVNEEDVKEVRGGLKRAKEALKEGFDLVILDEIGVAVEFGLVSEIEVETVLEERGDEVEVVLTGRWMGEMLKKNADYVVEIKNIKHPYNKGVRARKGVEY